MMGPHHAATGAAGWVLLAADYAIPLGPRAGVGLLGPTPLPGRGFARLQARHALQPHEGCDLDFLVAPSAVTVGAAGSEES